MKTLDVMIPDKAYSLIINRGIINNIGEEINKIYKGNKVAIITDENVNRFYGEKVTKSLARYYRTKLIPVKPGEQSKSYDCALYLYNSLLDFEISRGDVIIALGGGVVGDLAGYVASTLLRGIPFIQIPTSLLAQIDSSVGGKVAINLPRAKNIVGSFYHPLAVFIDPNVLDTLEKRYLYDGTAEVIKYGCIDNKELFNTLNSFNSYKEYLENIENIIYICCDMKRKVVEKDEKDMGLRMILNFGHTLGHIIEKNYNYEKYTHGEAVAIGMYNITKKSEQMSLTQKDTAKRIKDILIKYNLPYELPEQMDRKESIKSAMLDKKNKSSYMNIVLLESIGKCFIKKIKKEEIEKYI